MQYKGPTGLSHRASIVHYYIEYSSYLSHNVVKKKNQIFNLTVVDSLVFIHF